MKTFGMFILIGLGIITLLLLVFGPVFPMFIKSVFPGLGVMVGQVLGSSVILISILIIGTLQGWGE